MTNSPRLSPELQAQADHTLSLIVGDLNDCIQRVHDLVRDHNASYLHVWMQLIRDLEDGEEIPCHELDGQPHYMAAVAATAILRLAGQER